MKLLLLHGMGGNGRLWDGLAALAAERGLETVAPDLAGHGSAPHLSRYSYEVHANNLLERIGQELSGDPLWIIGHSLGGAVGIALASMDQGDTGLDVRGVVSIGMKTDWPQADVAFLHKIADKGVLWFDTQADAVVRYVTLSGLAGILSPGAPAALAGVVLADGRWRFAGDPEVFRTSPAPIAPYVQKLRCPLLLASGVEDPMAPPPSLKHLGKPVVAMPNLGHNAHVQAPGVVLALVDQLNK